MKLSQLVLWLVLGVVSGCGGGGGEGDSGGGGGPTATTLFSDDFSSGNLNQWVSSGSSATDTISSDAAFGNAAPSMLFSSPPGASGSSLKVTSNTSFTQDGSGLTFSFHGATRADGQVAVVMGSGNCRGTVQVDPTQMAYSIKTGNTISTATQAINPDTNFHTYVFQISPAGATTLYRDGQLRLQRAADAPCTSAGTGIYLVEASIFMPDSTLGVTVNVDNFLVTRP